MPDNANEPNQKKRGLKPRSKRQRKRPRPKNHQQQDTPPAASIVALPWLPHRWVRTLEPYPYIFCSYAKARWVGRTILNVYADEFGSYPREYYQTAIEHGRIQVNDLSVSIDYSIADGDVLTHTVHRHEPAIAVGQVSPPHVDIVIDNDDILAVDKPAAVPIHACGGYHHNSLMNMLELNGYDKLYTIHRLDRLTSGLVVLGKASVNAQQWGTAIKQRKAQKLYVARVKGEFPLQVPSNLPRLTGDKPVFGEFPNPDDLRRRYALGYWIDHDRSLPDFAANQHSASDWLDVLSKPNDMPSDYAWFHLACPVRIENPKDGVCRSGSFADLDHAEYRQSVKPASTSFAVIGYDPASDSTIVLCRPNTGRTHQIRLHLQHLGHPIANDPNYGGDMWFEDPQGRQACEKAQALLDSDDSGLANCDVPATAREVDQVAAARPTSDEPLEDFIRRTCVWCARSAGRTDRAVWEFLVRSPGIWLHALQYTVEINETPVCVRTKLPAWSQVEKKDSNDDTNQ